MKMLSRFRIHNKYRRQNRRKASDVSTQLCFKANEYRLVFGKDVKIAGQYAPKFLHNKNI